MSRVLVLAACAVVLASVAPTTLHGQPAPTSATRAQTRTGTVVVDLQNVRNDRGQLLVALFRAARGFPDDGARAYARRAVKARRGTVRVTFENIPQGRFAVAVHHDEDADLEMDTGLFGIPTEGYGCSRNAHRPFGPPTFDDCQLSLQPGQRQSLGIRLRY